MIELNIILRYVLFAYSNEIIVSLEIISYINGVILFLVLKKFKIHLNILKVISFVFKSVITSYVVAKG